MSIKPTRPFIRLLETRRCIMNKTALVVATLGVFFSVSSANAFTCFSNAYGTGCTGHLGTVAVTQDGAVAVGRNGDIHAYQRGGHSTPIITVRPAIGTTASTFALERKRETQP
jgi:hypothetical protein